MGYMDFTLGLAEEQALYLSSTRSWYATNANYNFVFDSTLKVTFTNTSLKCKFREDSIRIKDTRGTFYPFSIKWQGKNGKVTWERAG